MSLPTLHTHVRKFLLLFIFALIVVSGFAVLVQDSSADWQQTGSPYINWYGVTSSSDGSNIAAISNSYVYTSADGGNNWTAQTAAGARSWRSLASSADGGRLSAIGNSNDGNYYIFTSTDSGNNWNSTYPSDSWSAYSFNLSLITSSADGNYLVAFPGAGYDVYVSSNGGASWTATGNGAGYIGWMAVTASADGSRIYGVTSNGYIYASSNYGYSWTQLSNAGSRSWVSITTSADGTKIVAGTNNTNIYTSNDSGNTWTEKIGPTAASWNTIALSPDGTKLTIAASGGYIYTSYDFGVTWTPQVNGGGQSWNGLALSTNGSKIVAIVASGYIYKYIDTEAPTITSVSSDKADGTYTTGEAIDIDVTFSEPVTSGYVEVTLNTGLTCGFSVSNSLTGTCDYTVQPGDTTNDLTVTSISGTITDAAGNQMTDFGIGTNLNANKNIVLTDSTPPGVGSGSPSGTLSAGTTDVNLNVGTNEFSNCRYSASADTPYESMQSFSTTGGTNHETNVSGLSDGSFYTYYIRCADGFGNVNTSDYPISFSIDTAGDTTAPTISNGVPTGSYGYNTTELDLQVTTDESSNCKYDTSPNTPYASMANTFVSTGAFTHTSTLTGLTEGSSYAYYVRCLDYANNESTEYPINFNIEVFVPDTTPPNISGGTPTGALGSGTTQVNLHVDTDESATCIYDTSPSNNTASAFASTGGQSHDTTITGLSNDTSYTYYVTCTDSSSNTSGAYQIDFSVDADTTAPALSNGSPTGAVASGTTEVTLQLSTDEVAGCRYAESPGTAYNSMQAAFNGGNSDVSHSVTISGLSDGGGYSYYVRCIDSLGNVNVSDYEISFNIENPVDTVPPIISSVTTDSPDGNYAAGSVIGIAVNFSEPVISSGDVTVTLDTGGTCAFAIDNNGTGTCNYTVQSGDTSSDITVTSVSGNINDPSLNTMTDFSIPSGYNIADSRDIVIDTEAPTVSINEPIDGVTVSGISVLLEALASDTNLYSVLFKNDTDNTDIGSAITSFPFNLNWDTVQVLNGVYSLIAIARDLAGNETTSSPVSVTVQNTVIETDPPVISDGSPVGALSAGTTDVNLQITTDEYAVCKYDTSPDVAYQDMANTFSSTSATSHETNVTGLMDNNSYTYYVRCEDGAANVNGSDYEISFSVEGINDITPPTISNGSPTGMLSSGTSQVDMTVSTDEPATCVYDTSPSMAAPISFESTSDTFHSTAITGLSDNSSYTYYVQCVDNFTNVTQGDYEISFSVDNNDVITDTTAPTVISATSNKESGAYTVGEEIDIYIAFSEVTTSTGDVVVTFETGDTNRTCAFSLVDSDTGACTYTVQEGDTSDDLDIISVTGVVKDAALNTMNTPAVPDSNLASNEAIVIDTTAPSVSFIEPADADTIAGSSVTLRADASDTNLVDVQFKRDTNTLVDDEDATDPFTATLDTTELSNGSETLYAVARDEAGNYATSTITVTINNTVPGSEGGGGGGSSGSQSYRRTADEDTANDDNTATDLEISDTDATTTATTTADTIIDENAKIVPETSVETIVNTVTRINTILDDIRTLFASDAPDITMLMNLIMELKAIFNTTDTATEPTVSRVPAVGYVARSHVGPRLFI